MSDPLLAEAVAIGDKLVADAMWHRDRCTWLARPPAGRETTLPAPTLAPLGPTLYAGTAGVALFLGRLAAVTREAYHRATAVGALRHALRHAPLDGDARFGLHAGALGVAWVAHDLAARLQEPALASESRRVVRALAHEPDAPHHLDLTYGNAGAIPALLAMGHDALARRLGDELLAAARPQAEGLAWPTPPMPGLAFARPLAGMSHGAAGIALALARLFAATGEARYHDAALAGFRYERVAFDPELQTWGDLRVPPTPEGRLRVQGRWCHGAPGIGMARALAAPLLKAPILLDEARVARAATAATLRAILENPGEDATPCCGLGGVVDSLWILDDALGIHGAASRARAVLLHEARLFGAEAQARWPGFALWPTPVPLGAHPSLMQGVAGIGHLLLRAHVEGAIPSILAPP